MYSLPAVLIAIASLSLVVIEAPSAVVSIPLGSNIRMQQHRLVRREEDGEGDAGFVNGGEGNGDGEPPPRRPRPANTAATPNPPPPPVDHAPPFVPDSHTELAAPPPKPTTKSESRTLPKNNKAADEVQVDTKKKQSTKAAKKAKKRAAKRGKRKSS